MSKKSVTQNWKNAEKYFANVYMKYKIPAHRETRGANFAISDYEVKIDEHPFIKSDAKYSQAQPYRHHGKLEELESKYCKEKGDIGVLLTKNFKEHGACITVRDEVFAMLLSHWLGYGTKEELWKIYTGPPTKVALTGKVSG